MDTRMTSELVCHALNMAYGRRKPAPGLIFHSDRGSRFRLKESLQTDCSSYGESRLKHFPSGDGATTVEIRLVRLRSISNIDQSMSNHPIDASKGQLLR